METSSTNFLICPIHGLNTTITYTLFDVLFVECVCCGFQTQVQPVVIDTDNLFYYDQIYGANKPRPSSSSNQPQRLNVTSSCTELSELQKEVCSA